MIILDTNVVSEPMKPHGDRSVQTWLDEQVAETLYLTAISLSELLLGVEVLPEGTALSDLLAALFGPRVLAFDQQAATMYASCVSRARSVGRPVSMAVGQIAAIAAVHGFTVATRDTAPFVAAGVPVVNPWEVVAGGGAKPRVINQPSIRYP